MEDVVIIDAARSAVGRKGGSIGGAHPADMLGQVMMQLLARNNLESAHVDQVIGGCVNKLASQGMNITRTAWLANGGAIETPCITIDSQCGSTVDDACPQHHQLWRCGCSDGLWRREHDAGAHR